MLDNDLDVLFSGYIYGYEIDYEARTRLYKNSGNKNFSEQTGIQFTEVWKGSVVWDDYNLDNHIDLLISGAINDYEGCSRLYKNNGNNSFTDETTKFNDGTYARGLTWGDYNNDGFPDILVIENAGVKLYKNNQGEFFSYEKLILPNNFFGEFSWIDYDTDGDLDIYLNGKISSTERISRFYINNKTDQFNDYLNADIKAFNNNSGAIDWGDYDNDNDPDLIMTGTDENNIKFSKIYRNDGNNVFKDIEADIRAIIFGDVKWADYNHDGKLDFIITGQSASELTIIYHNDGNDSFSEYESYITDTDFSTASWADADNDNGLDVFVLGQAVSDIWYNNYFTNNTKPNKPKNLKSEINGYGITLIWDRATDNESTEGGLSYNVQVRKNSPWGDIVNPLADTSGFSKVPQLGNAQYNNFFILDSLAIGNYYWSVQAIDQSFMGGTWSEEQTFTITRLRPNFTADTVCFGDSTSFRDTSLFTGTEIKSWHWDFGDDSTSTAQNPKHEFRLPGKHYVTLTITDTAGVSQSKLDSVFVKQRPKAIFSIDDICRGEIALVQEDSEIDTLTMDSWRWVFGDEDTIYQQNPGAHVYAKSGTYEIELAILAQNGCSDTVIHPIQVAEYPVANIFSSNTSFCNGDSLKLNVAYNPNYTYEWKMGTSLQENGDSSVFYAKETGDYKARITNTIISKGCVSESIEAISVEEYPEIIVPEIESIGEATFCAGDSLLLRVYESSDLNYIWKLEGTPVYSGINEYYVKSGIGLFTVDAVHKTTHCAVNSINSVLVTVNDRPDKPIVSLSRTPAFCEGDSIVLSIEEQDGVSYIWMNGNTEITNESSNKYVAYESGNYYVDVINITSGCSNRSDTTEVLVTEMPDQPMVSTTNYDIDDCPQEKIISLSVNEISAQYTYQWMKNGLLMEGATDYELLDYLEEANYSVIVSNQGCENESDYIAIVYNPELPDKPSIEVKGPAVWYLVCTNDQALQYEWYYENEKVQGADEYIYVPGANMGTYFVRIAEENGCFVSSDAVTIPITGVNELDPFANLKIYPNPTPGVFTIEMDNEIYGELLTRIFAQNAVEIFNIKYDKTTRHFKAQIDLSGQGCGIYIISLSLNNYKTERKIVIEN